MDNEPKPQPTLSSKSKRSSFKPVIGDLVKEGVPEQFARGAIADKIKSSRREKKLEEMILIDPLTGLYNRRGFEKELSRSFAEAKRLEHGLTVLYIDLDDFKQVNDLQTHEVGDKVLKTTAQTIQSKLRPSDVLARLGGDEFVAILPQTDKLTEEQAEQLFRRLTAAVTEANSTHNVNQTISIGVARYPNGTLSTGEELVRRADDAVHVAKAEKNTFKIWDETTPRQSNK